MLYTRPLSQLLRPFYHAFSIASLALATSLAHAQEKPSLDVPYIKTPDAVVERMLELGEVGPDDYLIDLGSGDGRIPIAAAIKYGTRGLGVDLDPERTKRSQKHSLISQVWQIDSSSVPKTCSTRI